MKSKQRRKATRKFAPNCTRKKKTEKKKEKGSKRAANNELCHVSCGAAAKRKSCLFGAPNTEYPCRERERDRFHTKALSPTYLSRLMSFSKALQICLEQFFIHGYRIEYLVAHTIFLTYEKHIKNIIFKSIAIKLYIYIYIQL